MGLPEAVQGISGGVEHLLQVDHKRGRVGRKQRQRGRQQEHRQAEAEEEAKQAATPIEAAPQRQEEQGIENKRRRHAEQQAGDHRAAIALDGPDQQGRWGRMVKAGSELGRVRKDQVHARRRHARVRVVKVPIADQHHGHDHGEVGEDGHGAGEPAVDQGAAVFFRRRLVAGGIRIAGEAGEDLKQGISRPRRLRLGARGRRLAGQDAIHPLGPLDVAGRQVNREDIGDKEDHQGDAGKGQPAGGEVRLQERPANHPRVEEQPHEEASADDEQPNKAGRLVFVRDEQQARRHRDQPQQIEVPHAPEAVELEVDADNHKRRQVDPRRRLHFIFEEDVGHRFSRRGHYPHKDGETPAVRPVEMLQCPTIPFCGGIAIPRR